VAPGTSWAAPEAKPVVESEVRDELMAVYAGLDNSRNSALKRGANKLSRADIAAWRIRSYAA
jgi:hypothetical protein